jgi:hypothetical protein
MATLFGILAILLVTLLFSGNRPYRRHHDYYDPDYMPPMQPYPFPQQPPMIMVQSPYGPQMYGRGYNGSGGIMVTLFVVGALVMYLFTHDYRNATATTNQTAGSAPIDERSTYHQHKSLQPSDEPEPVTYMHTAASSQQSSPIQQTTQRLPHRPSVLLGRYLQKDGPDDMRNFFSKQNITVHTMNNGEFWATIDTETQNEARWMIRDWYRLESQWKRFHLQPTLIDLNHPEGYGSVPIQ